MEIINPRIQIQSYNAFNETLSREDLRLIQICALINDPEFDKNNKAKVVADMIVCFSLPSMKYYLMLDRYNMYFSTFESFSLYPGR